MGHHLSESDWQTGTAYKVFSLVCRLLAWERGYLSLILVRMCGCNDICLLSEQHTLHTTQ